MKNVFFPSTIAVEWPGRPNARVRRLYHNGVDVTDVGLAPESGVVLKNVVVEVVDDDSPSAR